MNKRKRVVAESDAEAAVLPPKKVKRSSSIDPAPGVAGSDEASPGVAPLPTTDDLVPGSNDDAVPPSPPKRSQKSKKVNPDPAGKSGVETSSPQKLKKKRKKGKKPPDGEAPAPHLAGEETSKPLGGAESSPCPEGVSVGQQLPEDSPQVIPSSGQVGADPAGVSSARPVSPQDEGASPQASPVFCPPSPETNRATTGDQTRSSSSQQPSTIDFMLSNAFLGNMRAAEIPDLDIAAQEALTHLLRAGCLFDQLSQDSASSAEVEKLQQEVEGYRAATQEAHNEWDKLQTQVVAQTRKLTDVGVDMNYHEEDLTACKERTDDLELDWYELQQEVKAKTETINASRAACIVQGKEIAFLQSELGAANEALADVRSQLEVENQALADMDSKIKTSQARLVADVAAEVVEERGRDFFLAKAHVQHLYPGINLDGMGAFKKITSHGLVGLDDSPGFTAERFAAAEIEREKSSM
ncbi:uncharacterized protein LOC130736703 [Lotus japonicus]|uniref:uncharacterized protein LOC130736703 n=1 Tax=Lotus japonicus TaxID=34305 RepID=UPI00258E3E1C|nr:uncharacterized protein LOC130736703 [Lotus japonicus]